jgi:hypothetical protein
MPKNSLIGRVKLEFDNPNLTPKNAHTILQQLSAVVRTKFAGKQQLWLGNDELNSGEFNAIECLEKIDDFTYKNHRSFLIKDLLKDFADQQEEIDIEGLDFQDNYLWLVGSHSSKRKKVGKDDREKGKIDPDGKSLKDIIKEANRYTIARIPLVDGELKAAVPEKNLFAAMLPRQGASNDLVAALTEDEHLGSLIKSNLPSKENGLDIEGFVIKGEKIFLGLRGPVLRGISVLLEIEVKEKDGGLKLQSIGQRERPYKKHFLDLDGLGVREFAVDGDDLIILAGPTMDLDGTLRVFRLKHYLKLEENSYSEQDKDKLIPLFDIPHGYRTDKAEGITFLPLDEEDRKAILVVYDSPNEARVMGKRAVLADIFRLD